MMFWATLWRYTPLLLLGLVWEGVTQAHLVAPNVLPKLSTVLATVFRMSQDDLVLHMALSLTRGAAGLAPPPVVRGGAGGRLWLVVAPSRPSSPPPPPAPFSFPQSPRS